MMTETVLDHAAVATQLREFLNTREVSDMTGIPVGTLRFWRHKRQGPESFALGKKVMYRRSEVTRWIAEQEAATRRGGTPEVA